MSARVEYSLIFVNNSTNAGNAAVFQNDPDIGVSNIFSLAWFSKFLFPDTEVNFGWQIDYSSVWSETGLLAPGVRFRASQNLPTDLTTDNLSTLNFNQAYQFLNQQQGPNAGTIYISQNSNIPLRQASVGIGVSGEPAYVVQAQPNINLAFTPKPKYFLVFGNFQQGEVLDVGALTDAVELQYPPGVFSLTATLNLDNTITVRPTALANEEFLAARKEDPQAKFGVVPAA